MSYEYIWSRYDFIPYDLKLKLDVRLSNIISMLNDFFQNVLISTPLNISKVSFFIAGSCIKKDTFRDIDMFFPKEEIVKNLNNSLDKNYFEYENNSYTYKFKDELFQFVYREKYKECTLKYLVSGFDFDSTKIAFECELDAKTKSVKVLNADVRKEFINYVLTSKNNLACMSINPFVSLQRAIHFLKRGDDVPYSTFLDICSSIAKLQISENESVKNHFERLQGNPNKLQDIKEAISEFIENKSNNKR